MVRVATLLQEAARRHRATSSPDGLTHRAAARRDPRSARAAMLERSGRVLAASCCGRRSAAERHPLPRAATTTRRRSAQHLAQYFKREILPAADAAGVRSRAIRSRSSRTCSKNFAVVVRHSGRTKFARVKVPDMLPRFVPLPDDVRRTRRLRSPSSKTSSAPTSRSCSRARRSTSAHLFRIIRDTDMVIQEDEADDLLEIGRPQPEAAALRRARRCCRSKPACRGACSTSSSRTSRSTTTSSCARRDRLGFGDWMALHRAATARR